MSEARVERRLAAILAADVVGYSRLMGQDEAGTLARLRTHRRELIDPAVAEHKGRVVKTTGDGILIEFPSVVEAVACAVAVQQGMVERNAETPKNKRIVFRVGINLGDIIIGEDNDIHGDGVNVAARLEGIAEPGGICVSGTVRDHIGDRLDVAFEDTGEQSLKNIARAVRVYRVRREEAVAAAPTPVPTTPVLPLPDKPSVAVLPFANMSSDPEQEFLADGIAEDVITALSRYPSLFVIARNTSFTYKGSAVDVKQVGRDLGVRYVLEGSLRKSGNRIRVTAQLIEAETGHHVWAERYDRDLADLFAVQDEITEKATIAIAPAIALAEQQRAIRKAPESLDAWAAYQRGLWHLGMSNVEDNMLAQKLFQRAIDLDPSFVGGYSGLCTTYALAAVFYQPFSLSEFQRLGEPVARKAIALDPGDAGARALLAWVYLNRGELEACVAEADRALAMTPNLAIAHGVRGSALIWTEKPDEGVASLLTCIRLDPRDPLVALRMAQVAMGLYVARDYVGAAAAAQRVIRAHPQFPTSYRWLAAALGQIGQAEGVKQALAQAIAVSPAAFEMYARNRPPWMRPEVHANYLDGLRKAGWEG